jgi:hypothetical protein
MFDVPLREGWVKRRERWLIPLKGAYQHLEDPRRDEWGRCQVVERRARRACVSPNSSDCDLLAPRAQRRSAEHAVRLGWYVIFHGSGTSSAGPPKQLI